MTASPDPNAREPHPALAWLSTSAVETTSPEPASNADDTAAGAIPVRSIIDRDWRVGSYAADCGRAAVELLSVTGIDGLTLRTVAEKIPMSQSGLHRAVGGAGGLRELIVIALCDWCRQSLHEWQYPYGALPGLPETDEQRHDVRVWSATRELAAGEARKGNAAALLPLAGVDAAERVQLAAALTKAIGRRPEDPAIDLALAALHGLRDAVATPAPAGATTSALTAPLTLGEASAALDLLCSLLGAAPAEAATAARAAPLGDQ